MRRWLVLLALLGSTMIIGCGDDDGPNDPAGPVHDGTIDAAITGDLTLDFHCTTAYGLSVQGEGGAPGLMQIQGIITQGSDEYMIDIQVYHDPEPGTYGFAFPPEGAVASIAKNNVASMSNSGSVTFTEVSSDRLAGTFSCTAFHMVGVGVEFNIEVTGGTFDVPVIYEE